MIVERYTPEFQSTWDELVRNSRNGTFLCLRDYMDYHADRFTDASLIFLAENNSQKALGVFVANINQERQRIECHGGLTYGGLVVGMKTPYPIINEMLKSALTYYQELGFTSLIYKPTPYIYHSSPCEEDLYWMHQNGAKLQSRSLSSTIDLRKPLPVSELRKRKMLMAKKLGLKVVLNDTHYTEFWEILTEVLEKYHATRPVHTLEEILLLHEKFPKNIVLAGVYDATGKMLAGTVLYQTRTTVHAQYIASSEEGRNNGALDYLFINAIEHYRGDSATFFDFGISTEKGGSILNEGLLFQKEGFGARGICYDQYELDLRS